MIKRLTINDGVVCRSFWSGVTDRNGRSLLKFWTKTATFATFVGQILHLQ